MQKRREFNGFEFLQGSVEQLIFPGLPGGPELRDRGNVGRLRPCGHSNRHANQQDKRALIHLPNKGHRQKHAYLNLRVMEGSG